MNITDTTPTVYRPADNCLIDFVRPDETPEAALARLADHGPDLIVIPYKEADERHEAAAKTDPVEITAHKFEEMLCILPPVGWRNTGAEESFKMCERKTGFITGIYVRIADRFFTFDDSIRLPHEECFARVRGSKAFYSVPLNAEYPADIGEQVAPDADLRSLDSDDR